MAAISLISATMKSNSIHDNKLISVEWKNQAARGHIEVLNGTLESISVSKGKGKIRKEQFYFISAGSNRLDIALSGANVGPGSNATVISVITEQNSFSFFLRDIGQDFPVYIPQYEVFVCLQNDKRSYQELENYIRGKDLLTNLQQIEREPEESFESSSQHTRDMKCPTWLGISRDIRIFEIGNPQDMELIIPRKASSPVSLPDINNQNITYGYMVGRGVSVEDNVERRLDDGILPIVNTTRSDGGIEYNTTTFVALESSSLSANKQFGTHFLVADSSSYGHMFTPGQREILRTMVQQEVNKPEETVLFFRAIAVNQSNTPRYAWFRTVRPGSEWWQKYGYTYDSKTGVSSYSPDRVFGISKLNGEPLPNEEIAVLLNPNEKAIFEFFIPHNPISGERAEKLSTQSFDNKLTDCRVFWRSKLENSASIMLPEKRIEEMIRAGLIHLDLITYGIDPDGTLAPSVGVYSPIGTESSPIIQFYSSMGLHDIAKRSLNYFLDKQHDDGMIQNFGGYMVETGAALWSMGEYFRYSRDTTWVVEAGPKLLKACQFLIEWRERNRIEKLKGKGYGMIDGKVADPEDPYHQYMLNAYAYLGISRAAEMLSAVDSASSLRIKKEAESWKEDIRISFFNSMAGSPVVPLGDGTWSPTVPPWTEARALRLLYLDRETFLSHGTFSVSDAMLGPLYLVFCEVLDPREEASRMLLNYHSELFYHRNAAFSQPYYSRHNWVQLKLGMVKPFLKTYYNTFSALADRETYTFWEHLYKVSVHKTHEEAWFLMETRWMLYLEEGDKLRLLPGVPRVWFESGKKLEIKNVSSYFGPLSFSAVSGPGAGYIEATVECSSERRPDEIIFRLPHPEGKVPVKVTGGEYDAAAESVVLGNFTGKARVRLDY